MSINNYYWIEDDNDVYIPVKCIEDIAGHHSSSSNDKDELSFQLLDNNKVVRRLRSSIVSELAPSFDYTVKGIPNDLVNSNDISEASILWSLKQRFQNGLIYTSIGPVIVAINPYRNIPGLYSAETLHLYTKSLESDISISSSHVAPPHIWTVARAAYVNLRANSAKQSIIVSGESGSGKTENTKKCLQYLSSVSLSLEKSSTGGQPIEERVLYTNPLLESFGNAKTVRNNNSSRFGKLISIDFIQNNKDGNLKLCGAHIISYLLEKSRVILHDNEERNYHIFYQMCSSQTMNLMKPENYNILNYGHNKVSGIDDSYDFSQTLTAFQKLKFADTDRIAIFNVLKAILLLGNVEFEEFHTDACVSSKLNKDSQAILLEAAELIGYDSNKIEYVLTQRTIIIPHQPPISVPLNQVQAIDVRNAFIKELYNRIFRFIVLKVNEALMFDERHTQKILSIGILDIFGFEIFEHNSFEQLCINFVNEKLQQFFIQYTIKKEIELYDSEGIHYTPVVPRDNIDILHLLESHQGGLFNIIDEETKIPKGSDEGFMAKALKHHQHKNHKNNKLTHEAHKMTATQFSIHHYAGQVTYDSSGFLSKNKDKLSDDAEDLFTHSNNTRINEIMTICAVDIGHTTHATHKKRNSVVGSKREHGVQTLAMKLQEQLSHLMIDLKESEPHFVRCVKPNAAKATTIDNMSVLQQLRYSGTLEAIKIRKSGYPIRRSHLEFWQNYLGLVDYKRNAFKNYNNEEKCKFIISKLGKVDPLVNEALVGRTMILFRSDVLMVLETKKAALIQTATSFVQKHTRRKLCVRRFVKLNHARTKIRELIQFGEQNNRSNVEALQPLKDTVTDAEVNLGMHCFILADARNLIERLDSVQDCLRKIEISLSPDSRSYFIDVIEEFHAIEEVQSLIIQLQLNTDATEKLATKYALLADMVDCLKILRSAIKFKNHEDLVIALGKVKILKTKQNCDFCAADEAIGNDILHSLELEIITCENGVKLMQEFLVSCIQSDTKTDYIVSFVYKNAGKHNKALSLLVEPYVKEGSIFNSLAAMIVKGFILTISLNEKWSIASWHDVYKISKVLYELIGTIGDYNHPVAERLVQSATKFCLLFRSTISFLREPIELNVVRPQLQTCLLVGKIVFNEINTVITSSLNELKLNFERLPDMKVLGSYGPILAIIVPVVEKLFEVRESCINGHWLKAIYTTHATEDREMFELIKLLPQVISNKIGSTDFLQDDSSIYNLVISTSLHPDFEHIAEIINTEFSDCRHIAINEFILTLISYTVNSMKMTGSFEDIIIDDESILIFSSTNRLIDEITKNEHGLRITKVCDILLSQFKKLKQIVELFSKRALEDIISLHKYAQPASSAELHKLQVPGELILCMDTMISISTDLYKSTINYFGINSMMDAMREGCLGGRIGAISTINCNTDSIEFCFENNIHRINDKSPKLLQYIIIVRALEQVRLEFLKENSTPIEQQKKMESLVQLIDASLYNFDNFLELVLIRKHLMYVLSKEMMMEALQLPPSPKYALSLSNYDYDVDDGDDDNISGMRMEGTKLLSKDGLILNYSLLETTKLSKVFEYAMSVLKVTEGHEAIAVTIDELPEDFMVAMHACEFTLRLRTAALSGQFLEALEILEEAFTLKNPLLTEEIYMSAEIIIAYAVISIGQAVLFIPPSEMMNAQNENNFMLRKLPLEKLEIGYEKIKSIEDNSLMTFLSTNSTSMKAHVYIIAIEVIYELRVAMRVQDWEVVDRIFKELDALPNKEKVCRICGQELAQIKIALLNNRISKSLVDAAIEESLVLMDGIIERSTVSTTLLTKALKDAALLSEKDCCSELIFIKNLTTISLNIRQAYIERRLEIPEQLLPSLIDGHNQLQAKYLEISITDSNNPFVTIISSPIVSGLALCMERDIHIIDNFHKLIAIESLLREACHQHGMKHEMIGCLDNHINSIKTEHIRSIMEQLGDFSKFYSLSSAVELISQNADFLIKMRFFLVKKEWELLKPLIMNMEGKDLLQEFENEVLAVRIELINSLFINDMFEALEDEQVLDIHEFQNSHVSILKLSSCLNNCDEDTISLSPLALSLFHTGKYILKLRSGIRAPSIDWYSIYITSSNVIHDVTIYSKIHMIAQEELQSIYIYSREYYYCSAMISSLSSSGVTSTDDEIINISNVETKLLHQMIAEIETFLPLQSHKVLVLFEASQNLLALREIFVDAFSSHFLVINGIDIDEEHIRVLLNHMEQIMIKAADAIESFPCADEIRVMQQHLHLVHIYSILVQSMNENEYVYLCRSQVPLPNIDLLYGSHESDQYSDEISKLTLTIRGLLDIEAYFNQNSLNTENSIHIFEVVTALKQFRYSVLVNDWEECSRLLIDNRLSELLSECGLHTGIPNEYHFITQEFSNKKIIDIILSLIHKPTKAIDVNTTYDSVNDIGEIASAILSLSPTSVAGNQAILCASNILLLRTAFNNNDSNGISEVLSWFKSNSTICPIHCQEEAQHTYSIYQNKLLISGLKKAISSTQNTLSAGSPVDTSHISKLQNILELADNVHYKSNEVIALTEIAKDMLEMRTAQFSLSTSSSLLSSPLLSKLRVSIERLSSNMSEVISESTLKEVAKAASELKYYELIKALEQAIKSFSLISEYTDVVLELSLQPVSKYIFDSNYESGAYASEVDLKIDLYTNILDKALEICQSYLALPPIALKLKATVELLLSFRSSLVSQDFSSAEFTLSSIAFNIKNDNYNEVFQKRFDLLGMEEVIFYFRLISLRKSIINLNDSISNGQGNVSGTGIYVLSTIDVDRLSTSIQSLENDMNFFFQNYLSSSSVNMSPPSPSSTSSSTTSYSRTVRHLLVLVKSSKKLLEVRQSLKAQDTCVSRAIIEKYSDDDKIHFLISQRIKDYYIHSTTVDELVKISGTLKSGIRNKDFIALEKRMKSVNQIYDFFSIDLGQLKILDAAWSLVFIYKQITKLLAEIVDNFNKDEIEDVISKAINLYKSSALSTNPMHNNNPFHYYYNRAEEHLRHLTEFELLVNDLSNSNNGIITSKKALVAILNLAKSANMNNHPWSVRARNTLKLHQKDRLILGLASSLTTGSSSLATATMITTRVLMNSIKANATNDEYALENYSNIKSDVRVILKRLSPSASSSSMPLSPISVSSLSSSFTLSSDYHHHGDFNMLSKLVSGFIRSIEINDTNSSDNLCRLVLLGKATIRMRDEIIIQTLYRIRLYHCYNQALDHDRLYRILGACLDNFPPSQVLEPFLLVFLWNEMPTQISQLFIRLMTSSVVRYGYSNIIDDYKNKSNDYKNKISTWLTDKYINISVIDINRIFIDDDEY